MTCQLPLGYGVKDAGQARSSSISPEVVVIATLPQQGCACSIVNVRLLVFCRNDGACTMSVLQWCSVPSARRTGKLLCVGCRRTYGKSGFHKHLSSCRQAVALLPSHLQPRYGDAPASVHTDAEPRSMRLSSPARSAMHEDFEVDQTSETGPEGS